MRRGLAGPSAVLAVSRETLARRRVEVALLVASLLLSSVAVAPAGVAHASTLNGDGSRNWFVGPAGSTASQCTAADLDFTTGIGYDSDSGAIQKAVDAASNGDEIVLCDHVYDLTTGIDVTAKDDLTFRGRSEGGTEVSGGGSVRLFDAVGRDITFFQLTLRNGSTLGSGGAVRAANVTAVLVTFTDNKAYAGAVGEGGGAIYASETVWALGSSFTGNDAVNGDGGGIDASAGARIEYSTFARNHAGASSPDGPSVYRGGGGVMVQTTGGFVRVLNSTFVANSATKYGSAIYGPDIEITNGTIVGEGSTKNVLSSWGNIGASRTYGHVTLTDTIVAQGKCDISPFAADLTLVGTNLKSDTSSCPAGVTTVTPEELSLQPLADNGGLTWTVAITDGSAARDATTGLAGDGICVSKYDQRVVERPQGAGCDIGAFELSGVATTLTVGPGGGTGSCLAPTFRTGPSYDSDYGAIQRAVNAASTGDTIFLCDHIYDLTTGIDVTTKDDLTFLGESTAGTEVSGGSAVRLFDAGGRDITLIGLTLRNGQPTDGQGGGALRAANASILGAVFTDNSSGAVVGGGAIIATGVVSATDATFSRNTSVGYPGGGAILAEGGFSITRGTFSQNVARGMEVVGGGALVAGDVTSYTVGTIFSGNRAVADDPEYEGVVVGGAILGPALTIVHSDFIGNSAIGGGISAGGAVLGGAMDISGGTYRDNTAGSAGGAIVAGGGAIRGVLFVGNRTILEGVEDYGGGALFVSGDLRVSGTTFERNASAGPFGGGAILTAPDAKDPFALRVVNSTFVGNAAPQGEGGAIRGDAIEISNGTFVDNTAATGGHVAASDGTGGGSLTAGDSIFSGGTCAHDHLTTIGLNLTTDASCPGDVTTGTDLDLEALGDNGGPTPTVALGAASVAIDASPECLVEVDQRGEDRPYGDACDIGAFELTSGTGPAPAPASATAQQVSRDADGVDLTSGVPTITLGDTVSDIATVTGSQSDGSGGYLDPTSGSVTFHYCYSASAAPTECTSGTWALAGLDEMDGGADATDGIATATLSGWAPPGGWSAGWYLLSAVYDASGGTYKGSETTGDTVGGLVHYVRPSVAVAYNGPWRISSSRPLSSARIAAVVLPTVAGCELRFNVSGGDPAMVATTYDATTGADGQASVSVPGGMSGLYGLYDVTVEVLDTTCAPASDPDPGTLAILPGTVANGSVGGGWTRTDGTRANFAHSISVTTTSAKVRGDIVTTTTTKGTLGWSAGRWRLKSKVDQSTTDGSSPWIRYPTCSSAYGVDVVVGDGTAGICGQFSGYGTLEEWSTGTHRWTSSRYGTVRYVVRVYDGGFGACRGHACKSAPELADWFGIRMWSGVSYTTPVPLPMSYAPVPLTGSSGRGNVANDGTSCGANGRKCRL